MYVCLFVMLLQIDCSFLFLDGIEPFFGRQFSVWHSTKRCSSIFDLGPLTPKIYSPKFGTKPPIGRLVSQIDRRRLSLLRGFRGWPIQRNQYRMLWGRPLLPWQRNLGKFGLFCTKSPISRLVCQIDRVCLHLPVGPTKGGDDLCCHGNDICARHGV